VREAEEEIGVHELSLAQSVLEIALDYAEKNGAIRVERLGLSFGRMSCIVPSALETAFEAMARGTRAEGARLTFEIKPVVVSCLICEKEYTLDYQGILSCPACGDPSVLLTGGTEDLTLIEMEVEQEE
jgi:hydrogenase nickel incorporation protein HypA/HybF